MFIAKYKNPTDDWEKEQYLVVHALNPYTPTFWVSAFKKSEYEGSPVINNIGSFSVGVNDIDPVAPPVADMYLFIDHYRRHTQSMNDTTRKNAIDTVLHLSILADKVKKENITGILDTTGFPSLRTEEAHRDQLTKLLNPMSLCPQTGIEMELTSNDPNIRMYQDNGGSTRFIYLENFQPAGVLQVMSHNNQRGIISAVYVVQEVRRQGIATRLYDYACTIFETVVYNADRKTADGLAWLQKLPELEPA